MAGATDKPASKIDKKVLIVQAILCVLCTLIGAFYPTLLDWAKTAVEQKVTLLAIDHGKPVFETHEKRAYPFSPITVVLANDAIQLSIALCFVAKKEGISKLWADKGVVLQMLPLGAIYAIGELLTLRSVQKGSGPVYVVIANMKLVVAAVMSRCFFGRSRSMPFMHWMELVLICCAAAGYTILEAGALGDQWNWEGAWMALAKSSLVAFTSVFCEHTYKNNPFHAVLTLQAFWGLVTIVLIISIALLGLGFKTVAAELNGPEGSLSIVSAGPTLPLCSSSAHAQCLEMLPKGCSCCSMAEKACSCISERGWDMYTFLAMVADLSNAISSALVFKRLSAVAKYVCRASSAVPMYIFYCALGRARWDLRTFAVVVYLCVQVGVYTYHRHCAALAEKDSTWVSTYTKPAEPSTSQGNPTSGERLPMPTSKVD